MRNASFKLSCILLFFAFTSLLGCYKKDNNVATPGNPGDLSIENAKSYFILHFKENAPQTTRTFKNLPDDAREAFKFIENGKTVLWDKAYSYVTNAHKKAIKVPLDFGNVYYKVNGKVVPYSSLNYLFMYIDSIGSICTEWVTLLPDTAWLQGKRDAYKGNILVRNWNGGFIKYMQFPAAPLSRNARTGDPRVPICIDIQNPEKCTCWDKSNCDLCPQCVNTYCTWPPVDPPEDPPFEPGQPSGGNSSGSNNPSPGGPVGGNPSDGDYPPNCNADPTYSTPTTPPPLGQEWALPCGSIPQPVEIPAQPEIILQDYTGNMEEGHTFTVGGYDDTPYDEYQIGMAWPSISNVIPKTDWIGVKTGYENCFDLATQQLAKKNYQVSEYYAPGQTLQIYTEQNGASPDKAKEAVGYILNALARGIPVLVGVDNKTGSVNTNTDNSTDHFIVIVGTDSDLNGIYFRFYDSATSFQIIGTHDNNKLYFNPTTGKITGKSWTSYGQSLDKHDYIITQVRKSKSL